MSATFEEFLTDTEMARLLKVSPSTIRRLVYNGPDKADLLDLRMCEPMVVGSMRRWPKRRVYQVLGIAS